MKVPEKYVAFVLRAISGKPIKNCKQAREHLGFAMRCGELRAAGYAIEQERFMAFHAKKQSSIFRAALKRIKEA